MSEGALLLDVRTEEEFEAGHVEGSVHIALDQLTRKYTTLQQDIPLVVVCESGIRSEQATQFLINKGYKAYNGGSWSFFITSSVDLNLNS